MGNTWVSTADPSLSAGAPLALLPGAAVALAVLAGAAVPGEPPQPATRAAAMLAPRQAHSARRAPAPPLVIGAENSPARAQPRGQAAHTARAHAAFSPAPDRARARECCAVNYRWRGRDVPKRRCGH